MKILLASTSMHKRNEFQDLFPGMSFLIPSELEIQYHAEETGSSFAENALIKAQTLWDLSKGQYPILADDSGLCVNALQGAPGIYSARWGFEDHGRALSDAEKNDFLLKKMAGKTDRSAYYVCALVIIYGKERFSVVQDTFEGEIAHESRGFHGFGYDPIFWVPDLNKTVGELNAATKHERSHRGRAARRLESLIRELT